MKEEIGQKILEKALGYLESAEAFLGDNIPKFIEEILLYNFWINALWFSIGLICLFLSAVLLTVSIREDTKDFRKKSDAFIFFTGLFGSSLVIVGMALFFTSIEDLIKIKLAPRVYLIEYVKGMK